MNFSSAWLQIGTLFTAGLKVRYRRTAVGFLWVLLNPLLLIAVQGIVFAHLLNVPFKSYGLYLISGFLPWVFLSQTLEMGTSQLKTQSATLKAFSVQPFFVTAAQALENFFNFFAAALLIVLPMLIVMKKPVWILLFWIPATVPLFISGLCLTFVTATSNILVRDLRYLVSFSLTLLYFLTPIFYPREMIPRSLHLLFDLNPIASLIHPFQILVDGNLADWSFAMFRALSVATVLGGVCFWHWKKIKYKFYLNI